MEAPCIMKAFIARAGTMTANLRRAVICFEENNALARAVVMKSNVALAYMNIDAMRTKMSVAPCAEPAT
jgi:hypothetical protein